MHKDNAIDCERSVDTLWGLLECRGRIVGMPCARCEGALLILYSESVFAIHFDNNISTHKIQYNIFIIIILEKS